MTASRLEVSEISIPEYQEQLWIRIQLRGSDNLLLECIYRSPSGDVKPTHHNYAQWPEKPQAETITPVMFGDFNLPAINWIIYLSTAPEGHHTHDFVDAVQDCFMLQHMDLVFSNEEGMITYQQYLPGLGYSEHICLQFDITCYAQATKTAPPKQKKT